MRILLATSFAVSSAPAYAHMGHWADLAGHDHWVTGAAIAGAILTGLYGAWTQKPRRQKTEKKPKSSHSKSKSNGKSST